MSMQMAIASLTLTTMSNPLSPTASLSAFALWPLMHRWLRQDDGQPLMNGRLYLRNLTLPDVVRYMIDTPLGVQAANPDIFDGIFYDGSLASPYQNMSAERNAAQNLAVNTNALAISEALSARAHAPGAHQVIGNGLATYHDSSPAFPADDGSGMVPWMDGVCVEHFAAFEMTNPSNCSVIPSEMVELFGHIAAAAAQNKTVLIKGWPGPVNGPISAQGPTVPASCNVTAGGGTTFSERAATAADWFEPSYALFLLVADNTVYWSYSWWYSVDNGYYPDSPTDESSAPANWYPMLAEPLGAPLGPARRVPGGSGWVMQRDFEHAKVEVDLADYRKGKVLFAR